MRLRRILVVVLVTCGAAAGMLVAAGGGAAGAAPSWWVPPAHPSWYWQLQGTPRMHPVQISDFDAFETSAATVTRFHRAGQHLVCYIDAGTWERFRPDAGRFPRRVLGSRNGWPGERWLDIRAMSAIEPIIAARVTMCAGKGFDAVEFDNIDGYSNHTGFPLTAAEQLRYDEWLAEAAHAHGLAAFEKNDPEQARALEPQFDGVLDEQCNQYHECGAFAVYVRAGKPVLNAEYRASLYPGFCAADRRAGIVGAWYGLALDGRRFSPCP